MRILMGVKSQASRNPDPEVQKHFTKFPKEHPWHQNVCSSRTCQQYVIAPVSLKISVLNTLDLNPHNYHVN